MPYFLGVGILEDNRPPSMQDVARLAGVSHQTVSRVLNNKDKVKDATRNRVLAAMGELGYRPNIAARALVTGRSRLLGVVSLDSTLFGPASTLYEIERATRDAFDLLLLDLMLPRMSGFDVCRELRKRGIETPVIMLTARARRSTASSAWSSAPTTT